MKIYDKLSIICLLTLTFGAAPFAAEANYQKSKIYPASDGMVNYAPLTEFEPHYQARMALHILQRHQYDAAKPAIISQESAHPNDLALFVAHAQLMEVSEWKALIFKYQQIGLSRLNATDKFKYGTVLLYYWGLPERQNRDDSLSREAQKSLFESWKASKNPIVGLMLAESLINPKQAFLPYRPTLEEDIFHNIIGDTAFNLYVKSKKSTWRLPPPPISSIAPEERLKALGLVAMYRSDYSSKSLTRREVNGKLEWVPDPIPPEKAAGAEYFKTWYEQLLAATAEERGDTQK